MCHQNRFDKAAATWDDNPRRLATSRAVATGIRKTIPLNPAIKALDIGCGTGLVSLQLAPLVNKLTALDSSEKMLAELEKKAAALGLTNVSTLLVDLEHRPIPGGPYDLIFSSMTFHHIKAPLKVLQKIFAALAPGGRVAVADLEAEDGTFHSDMTSVEHLGFAHSEMLRLLARAGFRQCTCDQVYTVEKLKDDGTTRTYPLFLATGVKP